MRAEPSTAEESSTALRRAIVRAWLVAGTIDIVVAVVYYPLTAHVTPIGILQGIASGIIGGDAFAHGLVSAGLGLVCHYLIALIWTVVFFVIYPHMRVLSRSTAVSALLYGVFVSTVMNLVVVPLSNVASRPFRLRFFVIATVILIFSIGLPLSIVARQYYGRRPRRS